MSEKVKVTKEVAEAIEKIRNRGFTNYGIIGCLRDDLNTDFVLSNEVKLLKETFRYPKQVDTFVKAVVVGYEVEPEFKIDDWVVVENHGDEWIAKVAKVYCERSVYVDCCPYVDNKNCYAFSKLRHATKEEIAQEKKRRFWSGLGRYVEQYRDSDIILNPDGEIDEIRGVKEDGLIVSRTYGKFEKSEAKLICPSETRLD